MESAHEELGVGARPESLLPLTPAAFQIMLSLADGERHGYSILREVEGATQGEIKLGPTTLYRSIRQMLGAGLIEETEERPDPALDDERRRYYRLTRFGRQVALAETQRLERLVALARGSSLGALGMEGAR
jgi:DNA-binding PadR family transcriptional regulator